MTATMTTTAKDCSNNDCNSQQLQQQKTAATTTATANACNNDPNRQQQLPEQPPQL